MSLPRYLWLTGVCLLLAIQGCTNLSSKSGVSVDYDNSYDFGNVRKIAIQPIARNTLETMLISDEQVGRIKGALLEELLRRDFEVVADNADADMYLVWRFIHGESGASQGDPVGEQAPQGTLYVNMIDPLVLQAKWRATFHADLKDQPETPEAAQYRRDAARSILAGFPP
jgi:hypothetical protein